MGSSVSGSLDKFAPINTKTIRLSNHVLKNTEIVEARRNKRKAERRFKKSIKAIFIQPEQIRIKENE